MIPRSERVEYWFWRHPGAPLGPQNLPAEIGPACRWATVAAVMRRLKQTGWVFQRVGQGVRSWSYVGFPPRFSPPKGGVSS